MATASINVRDKALLPIILIVSLFFLWGVANSLNDVLIAQFRKAFTLNDLQSGLVQSAFYFGYFVLAIPAALFMKAFGYKAAVVFGLLIYGIGALMFFPAADIRQYEAFLFALFVIAGGLAFLETSANPLIAAMGSPETSARRLNLAQAFNPLGAISGVLIGREFILSGNEPTAAELAAMSQAQLDAFYSLEAQSVQMPYLALGAFVIGWAVLILLVRFPTVAGMKAARDEGPGSVGDFLSLLARRGFMFGVLAQFAYVGAQVGIWSYTIRYAQFAVPGLGEKEAAAYLTWALVAFMAGRFIGTGLMGVVRPTRLMLVFALVNIGLCVFAASSPNLIGLLALASTSFFMSIMYPTIFAISIRGLGARTKAGASLLVMAIVGGAVITALMGALSDLTYISTAMSIPALCFAVVAGFALASRRHDRAEPQVLAA
jgi:FHS family L-fucose permease-like MFS transporter